MPALINSDDGVVSGSSGLKTTGANDGILALQNNGTTNVTVTAAGNVGIGTSSPQQILDVRGRIQVSNGTNGGQLGVDGGGLSISGIGSGPITFATNTFTTNLARIASDGSQSSVIPGGSTLLPQFACRAWVNFNGTGTVAIRASGNVSSITDNSTGNYTVNFTNAMPDANYTVTGMSSRDASANQVGLFSSPSNSASGCIILELGAVSFFDVALVTVAIFR